MIGAHADAAPDAAASSTLLRGRAADGAAGGTRIRRAFFQGILLSLQRRQIAGTFEVVAAGRFKFGAGIGVGVSRAGPAARSAAGGFDGPIERRTRGAGGNIILPRRRNPERRGSLARRLSLRFCRRPFLSCLFHDLLLTLLPRSIDHAQARSLSPGTPT